LTDVKEIAAALNAYHQGLEGILCAEAIDRWFADELDCRHEPPVPSDGTIKRSWLLPGRKLEAVLWEKAGLEMRPAGDVTVEGNVVTAKTVTATRHGESVSATDYTVEGGKVVAMCIRGNPFAAMPAETFTELAVDFEALGVEMERIRAEL
jgi:hypothetical protein